MAKTTTLWNGNKQHGRNALNTSHISLLLPNTETSSALDGMTSKLQTRYKQHLHQHTVIEKGIYSYKSLKLHHKNNK